MNKDLLLRIYYQYGEKVSEVKNEKSLYNGIDFFIDEAGWNKVDLVVNGYTFADECMHIHSGESKNIITGTRFSVSKNDIIHNNLFDEAFTNMRCYLSSDTRKLLFESVNKLMINKKNKIIYVILCDEDNKVESVRGTFSFQQFKNIINKGILTINTALIVSGYKNVVGINKERVYEIRSNIREELSEKGRKYAYVIKGIMNICNERDFGITKSGLTDVNSNKWGNNHKKKELEFYIDQIMRTNIPATIFGETFSALLMNEILYVQSFVSGDKISKMCNSNNLSCKDIKQEYITLV